MNDIKKSIFSDLTISLVSYKSEEQIKKLVSVLDNNISIIVVDNSHNLEFKKFLEDNHKNIRILLPKKNLGFGGGLNLAIKESTTEYVMHLDCDVKISNQDIEKLITKAQSVLNFGVITPKLSDQKYEDLIINYDKQNNLTMVSFNTGCAMLFKKKDPGCL